ncbi:hypothetical protein, partial [Pseudomonas sp. JG-B]|uniref:hypothetical protein n=1 Tax=Pseudomonas sp. JG-B TaxID=2603214 RepID=UPI001C49C748
GAGSLPATLIQGRSVAFCRRTAATRPPCPERAALDPVRRSKGVALALSIFADAKILRNADRQHQVPAIHPNAGVWLKAP